MAHGGNLYEPMFFVCDHEQNHVKEGLGDKSVAVATLIYLNQHHLQVAVHSSQFTDLQSQGCQSIPLKKPETDDKNLKKHVNLNQSSQKCAEYK